MSRVRLMSDGYIYLMKYGSSKKCIYGMSSVYRDIIGREESLRFNYYDFNIYLYSNGFIHRQYLKWQFQYLKWQF